MTMMVTVMLLIMMVMMMMIITIKLGKVRGLIGLLVLSEHQFASLIYIILRQLSGIIQE